MLKAVHVSYPEDEKIINDYKRSFSKMTDEKLVSDYNKQARLGFVGVRRQVLYMIGIHREFMDRFGESPVKIESGGVIFSMKGEIALKGGKIHYLKSEGK